MSIYTVFKLYLYCSVGKSKLKIKDARGCAFLAKKEHWRSGEIRRKSPGNLTEVGRGTFMAVFPPPVLGLGIWRQSRGGLAIESQSPAVHCNGYHQGWIFFGYGGYYFLNNLTRLSRFF
jgi:hypothetical protein